MITAPALAPAWAQDFAKSIDLELTSRLQAIPRIPFFALAALPSAPAFWTVKAGMALTGLIGVQASGGPTICLTDGSDWIDLQTGAPVA